MAVFIPKDLCVKKMRSEKAENYISGMKKAVPVIFGFIPVGIAYSVMATQAGLTPAETVWMSALVFAGASQIMAVGMLSAGAGIVTVVIATFIVNLRHLIMSTCVANRMKKTNTGLRLLSSFGITDESFAIFSVADEAVCDVWFLLGIVSVTYSSWVAGAVIGILASNILPQAVANSFGIALYAMFIALLTPNVRKNLKLLVLVVFTALINWGLSRFLDSGWAIIASTLIGAAAGVFFIDDGKDPAEETEVGK